MTRTSAIAFGLSAWSFVFAAQAAAQACPAPYVAVGGGCCWPGQTVTNGACAGAPQCPADMRAEGELCVSASAAPNVPALPAGMATTEILHEAGPGPLTLLVDTGQLGAGGQWASLTRLCTAPCTTNLDRGGQHLLVALGTQTPMSAGIVVLPEGPLRLHLTYVRHEGERIVGLLNLIFTMTAGILMTSFGAPNGDLTLLIPGIALSVLGISLGLGLFSMTDGASVRVSVPVP